MRYKDRNYTGLSAGAYPWIPIDHRQADFALSYLSIVGGTFEASGASISANIEGTHDNPMTTTSCKAFFLVTANQAAAGRVDGTINQPIAGIRINFGAATVSGSANATFSVMQAGNSN